MTSLPVDDYRPEDHSLVGLCAAWVVAAGVISIFFWMPLGVIYESAQA
jgi:hypothetical protein